MPASGAPVHYISEPISAIVLGRDNGEMINGSFDSMKRSMSLKGVATAAILLTSIEVSRSAAPEALEAVSDSLGIVRTAADVPQPSARPGSKDSLFDDETADAERRPLGRAWRGFVLGELAYTFGKPAHWSQMLVRSELDAQGALSDRVKWKLGARFDFNGVFYATDFYPADVRRDQRVDVIWRENYLDIDVQDWDFRLGAQH